jgi:CheY-like chemotaxis protein
MSAPSKVVAVSDNALRAALLDRLLDDSDYDVIFVEPISRAYSRIKELRPDLVVVPMEIDAADACQLLSMLYIDHELRGIRVLAWPTNSEPTDAHMLRASHDGSQKLRRAESR